MGKKLGPLPVWAWILIAGGTIGGVLLWKKAKAKEGEGAEPIPGLAGQAVEAISPSGGAGSVGSLEAQEAKESALNQLLTAENQFYEHQLTNQRQAGTLGAGIQEVLEAEEGLKALGLIPQGGAPESSTSSTGASISNAQGNPAGALKSNTQKGNPRAGLAYSEAPYTSRATGQTWTSHVYGVAVPGGIGPGKNIVLVGGPRSPGPSRAGSHLPANKRPGPKPRKPARPKAPARNPRTGLSYKNGTFKGKHVHVYAHAVSGGVGPHRNLVVV